MWAGHGGAMAPAGTHQHFRRIVEARGVPLHGFVEVLVEQVLLVELVLAVGQRIVDQILLQRRQSLRAACWADMKLPAGAYRQGHEDAGVALGWARGSKTQARSVRLGCPLPGLAGARAGAPVGRTG